MPCDKKTKPDEIVLRGIIRTPAELDPATGRPNLDARDFVRRREYMGNGPENGISVFRRCEYPTNQDLYNRIGSKKRMGTSEAAISALTTLGIHHLVDEKDISHLSLRCTDCDMATSGVCKPKTGASFDDCPFFLQTDPLNFLSSFNQTEAASARTLAPRPIRSAAALDIKPD
jgi:hypothetical protein